MIKIRPHHLFCMSLFSGHGYDDKFSQNMARVIHNLERELELELCVGNDVICSSCPNERRGGGCSLGTKDVECRDQAALKVFRFSLGEVVTVNQLSQRKAGITEADFDMVCGGCRWAAGGLCNYKLFQNSLLFPS